MTQWTRLGTAIVMTIWGLANPLHAQPVRGGQTAPAAQARVKTLSLEAGTGRIVTLMGPAASVFAADPRVAEVRPASPATLFVLGVAPGRTTIVAIGDAGEAVGQFDVNVMPSSYAASRAQSAIAGQFPGLNIKVAARPNGLTVTGTVTSAAAVEQVLRTAREYAGTGQSVESRLSVTGGQQVNLRVRIAEMNRNVVRNLGINWSALGNIGTIGKFAAFPALGLNINNNALAGISPTGNPLNLGGNINGVIDALAQDNLARMLAEPNLTAMSGESASFLVGGEFPIPVAQQNNQVTIEFKQYGVSLSFVATVLSGDRINMRVRPEVSMLTAQGAVRIGAGNNSIQIPALSVRRAETTVELGSGQSFAIAGLLQDNATMGANALPGIGEVPILGALFRSDAFQRNETELVIVITPTLVAPAPTGAGVKLPTDGWKPPTDVERLLLLRQSGRTSTPPARVPGDAGFVTQ